MSFTSEVKEELAQNLQNARHCRIAELAALTLFTGHLEEESKEFSFVSESSLLLEKIEKLIKKIFCIDISERIIYDRSRSGKEIGRIALNEEERNQLFSTLKVKLNSKTKEILISPVIYTASCCKRAFLRGAFLAGGSLTDPEKEYHLEVVCGNEQFAQRMVAIIGDFDIEARVVLRKKQYVVYVKDSEAIVDLLNIMEAHVALMNMENVRIVKDMRNRVNRRVNCETANIKKTSIAATKQIADIEFINKTIGLDDLGEGLAETARLRVSYPEASLAELGKMHVTEVGKSGVNHRLSKISEIAEKLKNVQK